MARDVSGTALDFSPVEAWLAPKMHAGTGALVVVQRGEDPPQWCGVGDRTIDPDQHWSAPDALTAPFWIASISKHFTATAVLKLAEEGRIDLDAPACAYLPRLARVSEAITVRHLLDSRSGLQHDEFFVVLSGSTPDAGLTFARRLDFIYDRSHLDVPPGTQTFYQATDFTLAGEIVEAVTGMSLDAYARREMFLPAGMTDSFYGLIYSEVVPRMAGRYRIALDGKLHQYHNNMEVLGDGSVVSTAADMLAWNRHLRRDDLAGRWFESFGAFREDSDRIMYGCGTNRLTVAGLPAYGKGGHSYAQTSGFVRVPDEDLFVLVLCNQPLLMGLPIATEVAAWVVERTGGSVIAKEPGHTIPDSLDGLWVETGQGLVMEAATRQARGLDGTTTTTRSIRLGGGGGALRATGPDTARTWGIYEYHLHYPEAGRLDVAFGENPPLTFRRAALDPVTGEEAAALEGRYLCEILDGLVRIRVEDGRAVLQWGPGHAGEQVLALHRTAPACYLASPFPVSLDAGYESAGRPRYAAAGIAYLKAARADDGSVPELTIGICHARNYRYVRLPV